MLLNKGQKTWRACAVGTILMLTELVQTGAFADLNPTPDSSSAQIMEEVLVVGRRPGPPLWRVVSGDNTLWIFGTLKPLPKELEWDNSSVKHILASAEVFIGSPHAQSSTSNPFKAIRAIRKLKALEELNDDQKLADVLPESLYQKFLQVKATHAPKLRNVDHLRPLPAAERLLKEAYKSAGLSEENRITPKLEKLARKQSKKRRKGQKSLRLLSTTAEVSLEEVVSIFSNVELEDEVSCFEVALRTITTDLDASIQRANAWASGDAVALLGFDYPNASRVCSRAIEDTPIARQAMAQSKRMWLDHARNALAYNKVAVASLPIEELAASDGLFAQLRAEGFQILGQGVNPPASGSATNIPSPQHQP